VNVEVRLHGSLTATRPGLRAGDPFSVELPKGATLSDLVTQLSLAPAEIHLVMVNGRAVDIHEAPLAEGDRVGLFPPVGGG